MLDERAQGVRGASKRRFLPLARVERMLLALIPYFRRWASGKLPAYARRRADTGDIVQEALIATLRRLGELDSGRGWRGQHLHVCSDVQYTPDRRWGRNV